MLFAPSAATFSFKSLFMLILCLVLSTGVVLMSFTAVHSMHMSHYMSCATQRSRVVCTGPVQVPETEPSSKPCEVFSTRNETSGITADSERCVAPASPAASGIAPRSDHVMVGGWHLSLPRPPPTTKPSAALEERRTLTKTASAADTKAEYNVPSAMCTSPRPGALAPAALFLFWATYRLVATLPGLSQK